MKARTSAELNHATQSAIKIWRQGLTIEPQYGPITGKATAVGQNYTSIHDQTHSRPESVKAERDTVLTASTNECLPPDDLTMVDLSKILCLELTIQLQYELITGKQTLSDTMYQPKLLSTLPKEPLPTMYDLPGEEVGDSGLPDQYHFCQGELLIVKRLSS